MKKTLALVAGLLSVFSAQSQSTATSINSIFQNKCISCHNATTASGNLDLSGSNQNLINQLVNVAPTNAASAALGHKRLIPGYPERSYLLRLLNNNGWETYPQYALTTGEDPGNHNSLVSLEKEELELIRQWVYFDCSPTQTNISTQVLYDYYNVKGLPRTTPPPAPNPADGFQIKLGPIFLAPGEEVEYYKAHKLGIPNPIEVKKIDCQIDAYSHHYLLFKYQPGGDTLGEGLREVSITSVFPAETDYLVTFTRTDSLNLPSGTAYRWPANTVLDLNYHFVNYNNDSIFAAEGYINVYTQTYGTAEREMKSRIVTPVNNQLARALFIPFSANEVTFAEPDYTDFVDTVNIWMLTTHTHRRGTDFDIYKRTSSNTKGEKIYEGFYDETYQNYVGYYNWSHPPIRYFDPLLPIKSNEGVIFEGKFINYGANGISPWVNFGLTTQDEMFIYFVQYTEGGYLWGVGIDEKTETKVRIFPNPATDQLFVNMENRIDIKEFTCFDAIGKQFTLPVEVKSDKELAISLKSLTAGIYFLKLGNSGYKFVKE